MDRRITIPDVSERDIDLLLLEEFHSSQDFCDRFAKLTLRAPAVFKGARWHVGSSRGESDLIVDYSFDGSRERFLIENKIAAGFQPDQAARYHERARKCEAQGECDRCQTVIVAPDAYLTDSARTGFDLSISYATITDWLGESDLPKSRQEFKTSLLAAATRKARDGLIIDKANTDFWDMYWNHAQKIAPELQMKKPSAKPLRSGFIYFRPTTLPTGVKICHKLNRSHVDLQLNGMGNQLDEVERVLGRYLEQGMAVTRASKSAAIRIHVPQLDTSKPFPEHLSDAQEGIVAAKRLLSWFLQHNDIWASKRGPKNFRILWKESESLLPYYGHGMNFYTSAEMTPESLVAVVIGYDWLHGDPDIVEVLVRLISANLSSSTLTEAMKEIEKLLRSGTPRRHGRVSESLYASCNG